MHATSRFLRLTIALAALAGGCATAQDAHRDRIAERLASSESAEQAGGEQALGRVRGSAHLERRALVEAVLARNPSLEAARAGWRASLARYAQEDTLDDPMLSYMFAPATIADPDAGYGQKIMLSQTLPWPGKRTSRGEAELYEAEMVAEDLETARLELALRACQLYDRYYFVARQLEINQATHDIVLRLGKALAASYATSKMTLYEPLQIEVMLAQLAREKTALGSERQVLVAQLNELMHRSPDAELPPPPLRLEPPQGESGNPRALAEQALGARPELRALGAQKSSLDARLDASEREYYPDLTVLAEYNSMPAMLSEQFMVGVSAAIPLGLDRRAAGEDEAHAKLTENDSQRRALEDRIRSEVHQALTRLVEALAIVAIYRDRLLPLVRKQAEAVRPAFAAGSATFFEVLASERELWSMERDHQEAIANAHTRHAELVRALGLIPGLEDR